MRQTPANARGDQSGAGFASGFWLVTTCVCRSSPHIRSLKCQLWLARSSQRQIRLVNFNGIIELIGDDEIDPYPARRDSDNAYRAAKCGAIANQFTAFP